MYVDAAIVRKMRKYCGEGWRDGGMGGKGRGEDTYCDIKYRNSMLYVLIMHSRTLIPLKLSLRLFMLAAPHSQPLILLFVTVPPNPPRSFSSYSSYSSPLFSNLPKFSHSCCRHILLLASGIKITASMVRFLAQQKHSKCDYLFSR